MPPYKYFRPGHARAARNQQNREAYLRRKYTLSVLATAKRVRDEARQARPVHVCHQRWPVPLLGTIALSMVYGLRRRVAA